jgi:hypothetical protein
MVAPLFKALYELFPYFTGAYAYPFLYLPAYFIVFYIKKLSELASFRRAGDESIYFVYG